jgi:hypothetical protein
LTTELALADCRRVSRRDQSVNGSVLEKSAATGSPIGGSFVEWHQFIMPSGPYHPVIGFGRATGSPWFHWTNIQGHEAPFSVGWPSADPFVV